MLRRWRFDRAAIITGLALAAIGCDADDSTPGVRSGCATAGGSILDCPSEPIETAEEACEKLVECGAIPWSNPEEEPGCCLDFVRCVDFVGAQDSAIRSPMIECVEQSSCDQLVWQGSPRRPNRGRRNMPSCLEHGDQP